MKCERCKVDSQGYDLHDYCALCSKNLCSRCMARGCCGLTPARSGQDSDVRGEDESPPRDESIDLAKGVR